MNGSRGRLNLWQEVVVYQRKRPDLFVAVVPVTDPDILPAIADGALQFMPLQRNRSKSIRKGISSAKGSLRVQLGEILADLTQANESLDDPVNVHCHGVASLPGEREVAVAFALSPSEDRNRGLPVELVEKARRAMAHVRAYEGQREFTRVMGTTEPDGDEPRVDSYVISLLGLFPPGLVVSVAAGGDEERAIVEKIVATPDARHPPPRDGVYLANRSGRAPYMKAWVTWHPHAGPPSYGEIRAAAERNLPHAFVSPRATLARPSESDSENPPISRPVLYAGAFDPTDLKWLEAFGDEWSLDRQDDHLASASTGPAI